VSQGLVVSAGDTAWVLVSTALVLLMVPGLALFYGGLVRAKSSLNTMMMSAAALGLVGVQWVLIGYSLAFEPGRSWLGGLGWAGLAGVGAEPSEIYASTIPHVLFVFFQATFAVITAALISGALVERMRFRAYLAFILLWTTFVYDPLAHWVWASGGWLAELGVLDFAGGTVVHISAGTSALVAALILGPRRGFGRTAFVPHNVPLTLLGAGLLWFGWFGFNGGSALAADGIAATAFAATFAAAAAALTTWIALDLFRSGRSTAVGAATGIVVGLVTITPAAGFVTPRSALVIGVLGAGAAYAAIQIRARTSVDDSLDVFACHGVAGMVGALLTGVFATTAVNPGGADGWLAGNPGQIGIQLVAIVATLAFAGGATAVTLVVLRAFGGIRVPVADEIAGVDLSEHGETAYYGEDVGALAGQPLVLGESVMLPIAEVRRAAAATPATPAQTGRGD
jgi:Amt family ammonium transporter